MMMEAGFTVCVLFDIKLVYYEQLWYDIFGNGDEYDGKNEVCDFAE